MTKPQTMNRMKCYIASKSMSNHIGADQQEWELALDLLIARAVLDEDLREALLEQPKKTCRDNGVMVPEGLQLVFTHAAQPNMIREIPAGLANPSFIKTEVLERELEATVFNGQTQTTETTTTVEVEVEEVTVEATTEETSAEVAAEAVAVIILT